MERLLTTTPFNKVILNVASSSLITHGIYVHFEAFERRFAPDEKVRATNCVYFIIFVFVFLIRILIIY